MTENRNPEAAWTYHDATKHSYASIRTNPHFMDWSNQPLPFKIYPTLETMRLPAEMHQTGVAALSAIAESVPALTCAAPDLEAVAQLLYLSGGITRKRSYIPGVNSTFARRPALERCTKSSCIWFAATCATCRPASTTLPPLSSACAGCAPEIIGARSLKPPAENLLSHTRHSLSFAPALTGATPGNIRRALTATSVGTTALSSPTFSPSPPPWVCLPASCVASSMPT